MPLLLPAAFAGHAVLSRLFPARQSGLYDPLLVAQLGDTNSSVVDASERVGVPAALQLLEPR